MQQLHTDQASVTAWDLHVFDSKVQQQVIGAVDVRIAEDSWYSIMNSIMNSTMNSYIAVAVCGD